MLALVSLLLLSCAQALLQPNQYFTIGHPALVRTRLDPIVLPGQVSSHVHNIVGSSAFSENLDFDKARSGKCSTSFIQADMSNYWVPQLYYKYKNGTYYAIQGDGLVAYWKFSYDQPSETFAVVPDDFRMLGGNISRDFFDKSIPSHDAVSFECLGGGGGDERLSWIPADRECETIRPQVFFPSCWNGKDAFLPDNSHVAYPLERFEGGPCPDGFQRIPNLFLEAYYKVKMNVPNYEWYPGCLVLANGDNFGLTFHGDWQNGWPKGMLVEANEKCRLPGTVDGCSIFEASRDEKKANDCRTEGSIVNEPIGLTTPLSKLPGNNPEFNSSRLSTDHPKKQMQLAYTEKSRVIPIPIDGSGSCNSNFPRKCSDYNGATGGGDAMPPAGDTPTTGGMMSIQTVPNPVASKEMTPMAPSASAPSGTSKPAGSMVANPTKGRGKAPTATGKHCSARAGKKRSRAAPKQ
ncbi:hypothetical protein DB88DRAFT_536906 [Papiliotrema laurentii]|uniref:DUF1996 domain-containing protein n=1 Tax=Papiliotrema laurentii TaxID=5418 RepID=A0AAD9L887_PAPLA|nr:hypothetical protein DB88DRAFT_536906 [Papiliotrema laurentii]